MCLAFGGHEHENVSPTGQEHDNEISSEIQNFITALLLDLIPNRLVDRMLGFSLK